MGKAKPTRPNMRPARVVLRYSGMGRASAASSILYKTVVKPTATTPAPAARMAYRANSHQDTSW